MPQREELERSLLGACRMDPALIDTLAVEKDDFSGLKTRAVFDGIETLRGQGVTPDYLPLLEVCHASAGGGSVDAAWLASLPTTTRGNAGWYLAKIREARRRNALRRMADTLNGLLEDKSTETGTILDAVEREFTEVSGDHKGTTVPLRDILQPAVEDMGRRIKEGGVIGVSSGYADLDRFTDGFHPGEMTVVAARPGIGKTAFAVSLTTNMAVKDKRCVGFFSAEMSDVMIGQRFLSNIGRFDYAAMRRGFLTTSALSRVMDAANELYTKNILVNAAPNIRFVDMRGAARAMKRRGAEIIFVDYLTLIQHGDPKLPRHERVGEVSKGIKGLSRELSIPMVVLSQLARTAEGNKPGLHELRQSGEIEEDADCVILLSRARDVEPDTSVPVDVTVAKNRNGPCGTMQMMFHAAWGRFEQMERG